MRTFAFALLLVTATAGAQTPPPWLGYKMPNGPGDPFRYYVDSRASSAGGLTIAESETATNAAFATWDAVACSYATFSYAGRTATVANMDPRDPYDQYNASTVWITSSSDPYYDAALGGGVAAAASIPLTYAGNVYQCDIYVNGVNQTWSVASTTPTNRSDLQTFIAHEVGHCQGLGHAQALSSVMLQSIGNGEQRRVLDQLDVDAICAVYPTQGAVGSPCATTCTQPSDGGSLSCIAPFRPDGGSAPKICSAGCDPGLVGRCPDPYVCKASTQISGQSGACLPSYGDAVTQVGKPCQGNGECGSANGLCITQINNAWRDGYCTQQCGGGSPECPAGAQCADFGGGALRCIKTCRPGTGDCRAGYACLLVAQGFPALCLNACYSDADCNGGAASGSNLCRLCDGVCLAKQSPTAQIGDSCTADSQCGVGQLCIRLKANSSQVGVCSQTCANACSTCPNGSACHLLTGSDEPWCLRSCTTGSCPAGQQCGLLPTGKACVPGCTSSTECPIGTACLQGECKASNPDAGCTLCGNGGGDGTDTRPTSGVRDAGTGKPQTGGCGCQGVADGPLWAMLALFALGARRRWPLR